MARACLAACVAAAAGGLCGCFVVGERCTLERQFTSDQAKAIRHGETTKKEVLDRLGPPAALARPRPDATDNVFRRLAAAHGAVRRPLVYRYDAAALGWGNICAYGQVGGGCIPSRPMLTERKLWILIDEETGRVVDHFEDETSREEKGAKIAPWPGP